MMKSFLKNFRNQLIFGSFVFLSAAVGYAVVTIPNTFTAGTIASADQVNANFAALQSAVETLQTQTATLQTQVATLQDANPLPSSSGRLAYAFVNQGTGEVVRSFNSSGAANTAEVTGTGEFTVTIAGLADEGSVGGNVQVTASGTQAYCQADPAASGSDVVVNVSCYDDIGDLVDTDFTILYIQ